VETDGRHAVVEFAETIEEDLSRRDFTINALAWRPSTGEIRDPHGGAEDLGERRLRAVGDPRERFAEDYLRVLRGLRFAGRFGLEVDSATRAALEAAVPGLDRLSAERVREELMKSLAGPRAGEVLALYADTGAMDHWLPELATVAREDPRWQSTLAAIDAIPRSRAFLRLVRLLLALPREDAGEPGTRSDEVDRPAAGATSVSAIMDRLKFSRSESRRAEMLWSRYLPLVSPVDSAAAVREWLSEAGRDQARDLFRLHFALARASGARESERALIHVWGRVHDELVGGAPLELSDLAVDGNDMIGLGLPRGPLVGLMLEELHAQVIEDPSRNQRETLLAEARELIELGALDGLDGDL